MFKAMELAIAARRTFGMNCSTPRLPEMNTCPLSTFRTDRRAREARGNLHRKNWKSKRAGNCANSFILRFSQPPNFDPVFPGHRGVLGINWLRLLPEEP